MLQESLEVMREGAFSDIRWNRQDFGHAALALGQAALCDTVPSASDLLEEKSRSDNNHTVSLELSRAKRTRLPRRRHTPFNSAGGCGRLGYGMKQEERMCFFLEEKKKAEGIDPDWGQIWK
uniref:Uncharacterized protein n=1 Tax=Knipowitschia caucasica TaxID=637954 RepID=A0AAV2MB70_KNICA